jgi:hypothetical protein
MVYICRIKLEQFQLGEGPDGICDSDRFWISIQESGVGDRVQKTGLLCGEKTGLESKNELKTLIREENPSFLVLLPVTGASKVFFNFDLETDEANWRLKISREEYSEDIRTTILGMMTYC